MLKRFQQYFAPPAYPDPEIDRQARFITYIVYVVYALAGLALLLTPFGLTKLNRVLPIGLTLLAAGIIVRQLVHHNRVHLGGIVITAVVWGILTFSHATNGGIHSTSVPTYVIVVLIAGLVLGRWGQWGYVFASLFTLWLFAWLESSRGVVFPGAGFSPVGVLISTGITLIGVNALVQVALRDLKLMVARLEENQRRLQENNRDLEASRALLQSHARELEKQTQALQQRSAELRTIAEMGQALTQLQDLDAILQNAVRLIGERFTFYHVGIFLLDANKQYAVLRAANSEGGQRMLARRHRLKVGEQGIVGYVATRKEARIALNVGRDAEHFENPDLPHTRSEMALPLMVGDDVLGVLDIQSTQEDAFSEDDVATMQVLANQLATAIRNALLFTENQRALEAARRAYAESTRQAWQQFLQQRRYRGYLCDELDMVSPVQTDWSPEMRAALHAGRTIMPDEHTLAAPVQVRGQTIGVVRLRKNTDAPPWNSEERTLVQAMVEQLALAADSARLYTATQLRAERERLTAEIVNRMRASNDPQTILRTAVQELRSALGVSQAQVLLQPQEEE